MNIGRLVVLAGLVLGLGCRPSESQPAAAAPSASEPEGEADVATVQAPPAPPPPSVAVVDAAIRAAKDRAQREVLGAKDALQPELQPLPVGALPGAGLTPEPMPGFFVPLDMPPQGDPLAALESALAEIESGTRTEPVRLAIYGASGTAADLWTAYLRRYLQARFGDGGPGIVSAAPQNRWYRHHELAISGSKHWTKNNAYRQDGEHDPGYYGPIGVCHTASHKRAWTQIETCRTSPEDRNLAFFEVLHLQQPGGGGYRLLVGGKKVGDVSTRLAEGESTPVLGTHRIELDGGQPKLRIEVEGDGPVRVLGVVAETGQPGIVVDTLALDGAKITNQLMWNEPLWAQSLQRRDPVLYALAFGTNDSVDEDEPLATWEAGFRTVLERFRRTLPKAGCIVIGPGDYPKVEKGELLPRPRLDEIREVQRRLAPEFECAFWDTLQFAGGNGSKAAWVAAGLARDDYLHMTRAGYVRFGMAFADALMQRYDWRRVAPKP